MTDLYREEILEHWQNPLNFGVMKGADLVIEQVNPLCGDEVTFYFKLQKVKDSKVKSKVVDVSFIGSGCAISTASASILSEEVKGKSLEAISKITGEDVFKLLGGPVAPARLKCAFLSLEAFRRVVSDK